MPFQIPMLEVKIPDRISYGSSGGQGFNTDKSYKKSGVRYANVNWQESLGRWDLAYGLEDQDEMEELYDFHQSVKGSGFGFRMRDHLKDTVINRNFGRGDGVTTQFQLRTHSSNYSYSSDQISFTASTKTIAYNSTDVPFFTLPDTLVYISGATNNGNNGIFTVTSVASDYRSFTVKEDIIDEVVGAVISLEFNTTLKTIYKPLGVIPAFPEIDTPYEVTQNGTPISTGFSTDPFYGLVTFDTPPALGDYLEWSGNNHFPVAFEQDRLDIAMTMYKLHDLQVFVEELKIVDESP